MTPHESLFEQAARALENARALVITAGAGMGVDSGLPDFRGNDGFWRAYPPYKELGLGFSSLANPRWFASDPTLAWGFYGHRLELYRATVPHPGFEILARFARRMADGYFVFTSNVDGQFQRAGFDPERIVECHGAIDFLQCTTSCGAGIFPAAPYRLKVDPTSFRAAEPLPKCLRCGAMARPNVLMFGDAHWDGSRTYAQEERLDAWFSGLPREARGRVVVIECGAGTAIPTVRSFSERIAKSLGGLLVRINVREPEVPSGHVGLPLGARAALSEIQLRFARGAQG
ncbi:Sir2 family NAD-dependent protein deacetylase [Polyangium sp. 15x6]|uniref:SIR2 family NAD-dependent protein deacylase n=1 Tax=Polyangium sp. 15x6 TaxID=3042687 RepID=UPI00249AEA3F|nr:Sir2 family NAD-dependent protein deacetylase [Polyangium sp. 15x6]MDI3289226.1 Sir2 family NAD-dependent protein deacetylase [Polyangium sp. 15x6]